MATQPPIQPTSLIEARPEEKSEGYFSALTSLFSRPFQYARSVVWHSATPKQRLKAIEETAEIGISRSIKNGVQSYAVATNLHGRIAKIFTPEKQSEKRGNLVEVGPVAKIPGMPIDSNVTLPPTLQEQVEGTDWEEQTKLRKENLTKKLSSYTTLIQMRNRCGIEEPDNLRIMNLVKRSTEGSSPESIWSLFMTEYKDKLSFFGKISAFFFYWIYYQSSLIDNTVNAYLGSFIETIEKDLTTKSDDTRTLLFEAIIRNTNEFLIADKIATKNFAAEKNYKSLVDHRNHAIEQHYDFSLEKLCKKFSEKQVDTNVPTVEFFKEFKNIPVIGLVFRQFETFVNWFFIRRSMKYWILPSIMQSSVEKSFESTQSHNLPFTLARTKFITSQLEKFYIDLKEGKEVSTPKQLPGTEQLAETIENLLYVLELETEKTAPQLNKKIKQEKNLPSKKIQESIRKGIENGGISLFHFLNERVKSGELLSKALELASEPFSGEVKDSQALKAEYAIELPKLDETAEKVFKLLIRKAISSTVSFKASTSKQTALANFYAQKAIIKQILEELSKYTNAIKDKVERSKINPDDTNNAQQEIAACFQVLTVLAKQNRLTDRPQGLSKVDYNEICRAFSPIFDQIENLQQKLLKLQEGQRIYPKLAKESKALCSIKDLFSSIRLEFYGKPRHLRATYLQKFESLYKEIEADLGPKAPVSLQLKKWLEDFTKFSEKIVADQQVIDACEALYTPRNDGQDHTKGGYLDQLIAYDQRIALPDFDLSSCRKQIQYTLQFLPNTQAQEIRELLGNGRDLKFKYEKLSEVLNDLYKKHTEQQNEDKKALDTLLNQALPWLQTKEKQYTKLKTHNYAKLKTGIISIQDDLKKLTLKTNQSKLNISQALSSSITHMIPIGISVMGTGLVSASGLPYPGPLTYAVNMISGVADRLFHPVVPNDSSVKTKLLKKIAVLGAAGGAGYALLSQKLSTMISAGFGVLTGNYAVGVLEDRTFDEVWKVVTSANKLIQDPRIYKAFTTRTLVELSKEK